MPQALEIIIVITGITATAFIMLWVFVMLAYSFSTKGYESLAIKKITDYFSKDNQREKAIEELRELADALRANINRDDILQEMADVHIMLTQMKHYYSISNTELSRAKRMKLERTIERIDSGYYDMRGYR